MIRRRVDTESVDRMEWEHSRITGNNHIIQITITELMSAATKTTTKNGLERHSTSFPMYDLIVNRFRLTTATELS